MKWIVLVGLVAIEKIQLTVELATHYTNQGKRVTVIDNVSRLAIDPELLQGEALVRISGDILPKLADLRETVNSDVTLLALSETANLDDLFIALSEFEDIQTIGLLDLRTCDCFPHYREQLEANVDVTLYAPFELAHVLEAV